MSWDNKDDGSGVVLGWIFFIVISVLIIWPTRLIAKPIERQFERYFGSRPWYVDDTALNATLAIIPEFLIKILRISVIGFKYLFGYAFFVSLIMANVTEANRKSAWWGKVMALSCMMMLLSLVCAFFVLWLERVISGRRLYKGEQARKAAGIRAERKVAKLVVDFARRTEGCYFEGALLAFDVGTSNEDSMELDSLLITTHNIFVIETKYKSGTINARENAEEWEVISNSGHRTSMRNALAQAKRSCQKLSDRFDLPVTPIPIAVIVQDVGFPEIHSNSSSVRTEEDLWDFIGAFEDQYSYRQVDAKATFEAIRNSLDIRPDARERHEQRVRAIVYRRAQKRIIENAALVD